MTKHILTLGHSPFVGGAELALKSLIDSTSDNYQWTVVLPTNSAADPAITSPNVTYISLPSLPWWCYEAHDTPRQIDKRAFAHSLDALRELARHADVLLTNTITIPWLGMIAAEVNKPHIWYIHEYGNIDHNLQFIAGYDATLDIIRRCSSRVLTISNDVKNHLSSVIPESQIDIIHQSIDLGELTTIPAPESFEALNILCMGAIKPSKGQHLALEAAKQLPGISIDIVGPAADPNYAKRLEDASTAISNATVQVRRYHPFEELSSHNILLMCSDNEALGRVTLEGMASGRVVVGYGCRSTRELLQDNRGIVYTPNTVEQLVATLKELSTTALSVDIHKARSFVTNVYSNQSQAADFTICVANTDHQSVKQNTALADYVNLINQLELWQQPATALKHRLKTYLPPRFRQAIKRLIRRS